MRVPTLVEVDKMPEISNLLSACLFEINVAGLLASLLVGPPERERFLSSISQRVEVLMSLFQLIEKIPGTSMKLGPMPVLYNSGMWSEGDVLGGYTGPHVNVRPTELAVSYIAAWKFKGVNSRLVKATIWYILSGRTFEEGFRYLIDLFESGFIIDTNEFIRAGFTLLEIYSKASDPYKAIKRLPIDKDPGTTEKMMHSIGVIIKKQEANNAKIREIFGVLLNITYEKLTTAKTIVSLGELVLAWAKWRGLVVLVQNIERAYKSNLNLAIADEAILSPLEEFRADVAPLRDRLTSPRYFPFTDVPEISKFPIPLLFGYVILLFMVYKKTFAENAVDKLLEDRFMPGYFRNILEFLDGKKDAIQDLNSPWSDEMIYLPVHFAFPMGCIKDIEPTMMRMELLPKQLLFKEIKKMSGLSELSRRRIDHLYQEYYASIFPKYKEVKRDSHGVYFEPVKKTARTEKALKELGDIMYDLHLKACANELEERISKTETGAHTLDQKELQDRKVAFEKLLKLYPWFPFAHQEMCIVNDRIGDGPAAKQNIQAALLLNPTNPLIWQSFRVVCNRYSTKQDAVIAGAIADAFASTTNSFAIGAE